MMQILQNDELARYLHNDLYKRLHAFAQKYSPELPAQPIVEHWLALLYNSNTSKLVHIAVDLDNKHNIVAHGLAQVQSEGPFTVVYIHQLEDDRRQSIFIDEASEYVDKLVQATNAYCSVAVMARGAKAFAKKHGYELTRTVLVKYNSAYINTANEE